MNKGLNRPFNACCRETIISRLFWVSLPWQATLSHHIYVSSLCASGSSASGRTGVAILQLTTTLLHPSKRKQTINALIKARRKNSFWKGNEIINKPCLVNINYNNKGITNITIIIKFINKKQRMTDEKNTWDKICYLSTEYILQMTQWVYLLIQKFRLTDTLSEQLAPKFKSQRAGIH